MTVLVSFIIKKLICKITMLMLKSKNIFVKNVKIKDVHNDSCSIIIALAKQNKRRCS